MVVAAEDEVASSCVVVAVALLLVVLVPCSAAMMSSLVISSRHVDDNLTDLTAFLRETLATDGRDKFNYSMIKVTGQMRS